VRPIVIVSLLSQRGDIILKEVFKLPVGRHLVDEFEDGLLVVLVRLLDEPDQLGLAPSGGGRNHIDQFDKFVANPLYELATGDYTPEYQIMKETFRDLAMALLFRKVLTWKTSSKPLGCFVKGTLVAVAPGKFKQIDQISVGDSVLAYDESAKQVFRRAVLTTYKLDYQDTLIEIVTNRGSITATSGHPFYVNFGWREARELQIGDTLFTLEGTTVYVQALTHNVVATQVYNLHVSVNNNYFVSSAEVLVHNDCYQQYKPLTFKNAKAFNKGLVDIIQGRGKPRMENGVQKRIENRTNKKWESEWDGAEEYEINVSGESNKNRILRKQTGTDADGNPVYKYGASNNHYGQEGPGPEVIPFEITPPQVKP